MGFADGSRAAVDLVLSDAPAPDAEVFAALVFVQDRAGRFAVVYSPRRAEWASPGGWREDGEAVIETVVREVLEETGLELPAAALAPCAYERLRPLTPGRWPDGGGCLQVYRTRLDADAPDIGRERRRRHRLAVGDHGRVRGAVWGRVLVATGRRRLPVLSRVRSPGGTGLPAGPSRAPG